MSKNGKPVIAQPRQVCLNCGTRYGNKFIGAARWDVGICGCCGRRDSVADPRDFGYLVEDWIKNAIKPSF